MTERLKIFLEMEIKYEKHDDDYFIKLLNHDDYVIRTRAICILADFGLNKYVIPISKILQDDPNELVRHEAAFSLGQLCFSDGITFLEHATKNDQSEFVRHEAAIALGVIGSKLAKNTLINALNDKNNAVKDSATIALSNILFMEKLCNNTKFAKLIGG